MGANDQQEMLNELWEKIEPLAIEGGGSAVIEFAAAIEDASERRRTYWFARQLLSGRDWEGKDLLEIAAVAKAGIEEFPFLSGKVNARLPVYEITVLFELLVGQFCQLPPGLRCLSVAYFTGSWIP